MVTAQIVSALKKLLTRRVPGIDKTELNVFVSNALEKISYLSNLMTARIASLDPGLGDSDGVAHHLQPLKDELGGETFSPVDVLRSLRSIVVYSLPSMDGPLKFSWGWESDDTDGKQEAMEERVEGLHEILGRTGSLPLEPQAPEHLFRFAHLETMWSARNLSPEHLGPRSFCVPNLGSPLLDDSGNFKVDGGYHSWHVSPDVMVKFRDESIVVTPITASEDTFVYLVSYYHAPLLPTGGRIHDWQSTDDLDQLTGGPDFVRILLWLHDAFAVMVLGQFCGPLVQTNTTALRRALKRTTISPSLLANACDHLGDGAFSYRFDWNDRERCCADLRQIVLRDLQRNPNDVFDTVLDLQRAMYKKLQADPNLSLVRTDGTSWKLPGDMPLADVMREFEYIQRGIGMPSRDHVVHQFQTLLLGSLLINRYRSHFTEAVSRDLELEPNDPKVESFLKLAWFLCATLHDIGYPIQVFDKVSDSLREEVAKILDLNAKYLATPPQTRIDRLLYDDPRTYAILKELAKTLDTCMEVDAATRADKAPDLEENLWWAMRHLMFGRKRHAMVSTVSTALSILKSNPEIAGFDERLADRAIAKHVLLPIMLHHLYEWRDLIAETMADYSGEKKTLSDRVFRPIVLAFGDDKEMPKCKRSITFGNLPLAVLLQLVDFSQEWGRPAGEPKKGWPTSIRADVDVPADLALPATVDVILSYEGSKGNANDAGADFRSRERKKDCFLRISHLGDLWGVSFEIRPDFDDSWPGLKNSWSAVTLGIER